MNYYSAIFSKYLSDDAMHAIVADEALIAKMLLFETALAKAQASLGMIPQEAAEEITLVLSTVKVEPGQLAEGTLQNGVPVITLLSLLKEKLSADAAKYLHYGATSQDVMDTAQVLILRDAMALIEEKLYEIITALRQLGSKYGDVICMAHTRGQQAIPITFAVKINAWLQPLQRQLQRLEAIKKEACLVQLGGAAGTLHVYADKANALVETLAGELDLRPAAPWHTQRDHFCGCTNWLAVTSGIPGKMGADILVMSQSEINEITEREDAGKSSAMPHKNNPVLSESLVAIAGINAALQSQMLQALVHVNERDATAWILEWNAIPQMLINTSTALNHAITIATKMKVNTEQMRSNVERFKQNTSE